MAKPIIKTGTYVGTGAAITIPLGFKPDWVEVVNWTDADKRFIMTQAKTFVHTGGTNATAVVASNGLSVFEGATGSTSAGFTAGTEASVNGKTYAYIAMRGDE